MDEKKKTPKIRFKGFTDDWEQRKLGDLGKVAMNKRIFKSETSKTGEIPFYKIGTFGGKADAFISRKLYNDYKNKYPFPCKGDLLISASGSIGRVVEYDGEDAYFQDSNIVWLKHDGKIYNKFLKQYYNIIKWHGLEGSTIKRLYNSNILKTDIVIPSMSEQEKIGEYFDNLDNLITLHQRKCDKLNLLKKSMLEKMFPENGKEIPEIRFEGFTGEWEQCKLGELVKTLPLKPFIKEPENNGKYEIIQQGNSPIIGFANGIPCYDYKDTVIFGDHTLSLYKPKHPFFVATDGVRILKGKTNTDGYYLLSLLEKYKPQSEGYKRYYSILSDTECFITFNANEQEKIGAYFSNLDNLITLHQRKQNKINNNKKKGVISLIFDKESEFEEALIEALKKKGWQEEVLKYPTEEDLIKNWANILFENNRTIDRLNDEPLTDTEMEQILEQVTALRTPLKLNGFINGKTVSITRDNPNDKLHLGKEVSLKIYDRLEIAAGQSRYQIAQQPIFKKKNSILNDRRGDFMLLINGMPVIHVELKKSGIPVSQAYNQIEKYAHEGVFTGIYSLVQVFVAMNPEECVYFANPGPDGKFNKDFYFHWADFNNEPINDWKNIASCLLSIPMAHQLIGFYTVADDSDGILKVMRSYQYYAANAISDKVSKIKWDEKHQLGGYIWHTTGSGKTMSSFKSAQLIANSKDADKVVFLMDRVELGTQSLYEYRAFSDETDEIQATENTRELISKLKSSDATDTLIVTSIQKMSRIEEDEGGLNSSDIEEMNRKRIVFIIDEAHRSTFGEMLVTIKKNFPDAVFFGFTGTPIYDRNKKKDSTTANIFGNELHRYTIADGIRDGNVLGFDPYKCSTYNDKDLRRAVALEKAKAESEEAVYEDERKKEIFNRYMTEVPMAGYEDETGTYQKGIEDYIKTVQYDRDEHREMVIKDIFNNWTTLSQKGKFHAIFATSTIPEAIKYYRLIKKERPDLKVTALFDSNIDNKGNGDNNDGMFFKEDGLVEIINDYNERYGMDFSMATHDKFKKDISSRLAHKKPYERIENHKEMQLDILIVVDQMLTGFDSKWVNTLYLDKMLKYENIIQAFSRTNRLFGPDKPFGVIRYYRKPNTMERNIEDAVKYYSGDREVDLFVEQLPFNLKKLIDISDEIGYLFERAGIKNFEKLPEDSSEKGQFAKLYKEFNSYLEAAKVQGFDWNKKIYTFKNDGEYTETIGFGLDENTYTILAQRYKELANEKSDSKNEDISYDIEGYLTEIDTGKIDTNYMNSRFEKYLKDLSQENISSEELQKTLDELHKSFASLNQEEQKYANIFLHDVESGEATLEKGKSFREYITEYQVRHRNKQVHDLHNSIGVDAEKLEKMLASDVNERNINEFGRFDDLERTIDKELAREYLEKKTGKKVLPFKVIRDASNLLRKFVLSGGFDIYEEDELYKYESGEENIIDENIVDSDIMVAQNEND